MVRPRVVDSTEAGVRDTGRTPLAIPALAAILVLVVPLAVPATVNCPGSMARIGDRFCIDRYEAALVEMVAGVERPWSPYHTPGGARVRAVSHANVVPQGYISQI